MVIIIICCLALAVIGVALFKPKVGALLIWPILFCYPNRLWYELNLLPGGLGYDDIFIAFVALVLLFRRKRWRFPWSVRIIALYAVVISIGNVMGMLRYSDSDSFQLTALQEIFKTLSIAALGFCLYNSIDDEDDLRLCAEVIAYSLILGAATVVASKFSPTFALIFESATKLADPNLPYLRPAGTFAEPNTAGSVLAIGMGLIIMLFTYSRNYLKKLAFLVGGILLVAAILFSQSRTGTIGLLCLLPTLLLLRNMRKSSIVISIVICGALFLLPSLYEPMLARVGETFDPLTGEFSGSGGSRPDIWLQHIKNIDEISIIFGSGRMNTIQSIGTPHSGYLDLLSYSGLIGLLWFAFLLRGFGTRIVAMIRDRQHMHVFSLGHSMVLFLVAFLWCSIWTDTLSSGTYEFILLSAMLALADRATYLLSGRIISKNIETGAHRLTLMPNKKNT